MNEIRYDIRFRFEKKDESIYLSHLDLNRVMARAIRRSGLPVWYTKGFNPHPYLWFGPPLSLGYSGENEVLDVSFIEDVDLEYSLDRLRNGLPVGISIKEAYKPQNKISEIAFSNYKILLECDICEDDIIEYLNCDEILVVKKTKSGEKEINIVPMISSFAVYHIDDKTLIDTVVSSDGSSNLNPGLIVCAVERDLLNGKKIDSEITRNEFYLNDRTVFR